jgi:hypothetical protein
MRSTTTLVWGFLAAITMTTGSWAGELTVATFSPPRNGINVAVSTPISITFDRPVLRSSFTTANFWAFARWSGAAEGTISFSNNDQTVTLTPTDHFSHGEQVTVYLSKFVLAADGSLFRPAGYSWQFITRVRSTPAAFTNIATLQTRTTPSVPVRSYGGIASDLNNDGHLDITIVNEESFDLRVFVHSTSAESPFSTFLQPTFPVGQQASPSEPSDFNRDGNTDICVVNIASATVSILLGNGNGTYAPQQVVNVGATPRGNAVLDVDGDGDIDIVNTNYGNGNLSLLVNNGVGVFGAPIFFNSGGAAEYALATADMNNDGILDLIAGARAAQQIVVSLGNGNSTFAPQPAQPIGGQVWMLVCGDLNHDGNADVASVNSTSNTGSILMGNGAGQMGAPQTYATDPFSLGVDLGDIDGDGDLDWATSSFSGDWRLYRNDGAGVFSFYVEFNSPQAASCVLMFDCDNDRDLDLGLIDEIADVVILMRNSSINDPGDANGDGIVNVVDLLATINGWGPCTIGAACPGDLNDDDQVNVLDMLMVINSWG